MLLKCMNVKFQIKNIAVLLILSAISTHSYAIVNSSSNPRYVPNELIIKYSDNSLQPGVMKFNGNSKSQPDLSSTLAKYHVHSIQKILPEKPIVSNNKKSSSLNQQSTVRTGRSFGLERLYTVQLQLQGGQTLEEARDAFNELPEIEYAEYNYIYSIDLIPNDSDFPVQWALNNIGQVYPDSGRYNAPPGTPDADIDAPEAWDYSTGGGEVIVAVIDTGVDYTHRDLEGNIWVNEAEEGGIDGVDDDGNGYVDDVYGYDFVNDDNDPIDDQGHGTHCSGIIAAGGNNGLDIAGVCWDAKIMGLKFLGSSGSGNLGDAVKAVYYAVENGAQIISNSWGSTTYTQALEEAFAYAHDQGVIVVAAAGNDNSSDLYYPSAYEHVISVAALDSNDDRAWFSNYGEFVELAAPGVDILSLLAAGSSLGTIYNSYTTVASGTSMACPMVSGACAFLLMLNPYIPESIVYDVLYETGDPIKEGICLSNKRINLKNAVERIYGYVWFDQEEYSCDSEIAISLLDLHLADQSTQDVLLETSSGDVEWVTLDAVQLGGILFQGSIHTETAPIVESDGVLQVSNEDIITVLCLTQNGLTELTDQAQMDCAAPELLGVNTNVLGSLVSVSFQTDEPAISNVFISSSCGLNSVLEKREDSLHLEHILDVDGFLPKTTYYYKIEVADRFGNSAVYDNNGQCYTFTSDKPLRIIPVPGRFSTIQAAINHSWDGDRILLTKKIYTGDGNRDLDVLGKTITIRSINGSNRCTIDPQGTPDDPHRAFYFHRNETADAIIDGITFTGGYAEQGGVIFCQGSNPTIQNCVFQGTQLGTETNGGAVYNNNSHPIIKDCVFKNNTAGNGGAVYNIMSNPLIERCLFESNHALYAYYDFGGGAIFNFQSHPVIRDCDFIENTAAWDGGAILNIWESSPIVYHCKFLRNMSIGNDGAALFNAYGGTITIDRCLITGNRAGSWGGAMRNYATRPVVSNSVLAGNFAIDAGGAIFNYTYTDSTIQNCTFHGNSANGYPGDSILNRFVSGAIISNSIFWDIDNTQDFGISLPPIIHHSIVQGGWPGSGNLDADPMFVREGYWAKMDVQNIIAEPSEPNTIWIDGDYRLLPDSPCIDAGVPDDSADSNAKDLAGNARVINNRIDMGAYEFLSADRVELLHTLGDNVIIFVQHEGIEKSLLAKINAALQKLEDDRLKNDGSAVKLLQAFINAVQAQTPKAISENHAAILISIAQQAIDILEDE